MTATATTNPPQYPARRSDDPLAVPVIADGRAISQVQLPTGQIVWLLTRHEDVRAVLRSPDFSSDWSRPGFPLLRPIPDRGRQAGMFIRMDAPEHTRYRRLLTAEFMIKSVRALEPLITRTVVDALATMRGAGAPADLVEHFALPVPSMVICHLLGVPYADHEFFQERSRTLLAWSTPPEAALAARDDLRGYLSELVEARRRNPADDLLSRLATEHLDAGTVSVGELAGLSVLLLIAGHETTANMIGLSTLLLLRHPTQLARLRAEAELIDNAVEELLRYLTIVRTGLPRLATADTEIGGQLVRAGEGVIALLSAANRDTTVFPDGDELHLDAGSHQHVAFGFGIHQCLGQPLARAELRIALHELITRFPDLALAVAPDQVPYRDSAILGLQRLPVTW